jgi:epoxyqueuosine reductase
LGGSAEMARHSDACIDPEFGANMGYWSMLTDLPLAPQKPIDAGIFRFCHTCHKCANACPSKSISQDSEPSWEVPNFDYKVPNMSNNAGKKLFWTNMSSCVYYRTIYGCLICRPVCTFNENYAASIHDVVKATLSTTSMFNGTFWKMSQNFGYGLHEPEQWWEMSLPFYDYEGNKLAKNGGY